jgi:hypothetical protein
MISNMPKKKMTAPKLESKVDWSGSLDDFKTSVGMKADAQRKTAEAMPMVMKDLVDIFNFTRTLPPGSPLAPAIAKREEEGKKFVYDNRLYKSDVRVAMKNKKKNG